MKHRHLKILATFLLGLLVIVGAAIATPGIGVLGAPVHARGTLADQLNVRSGSGIELVARSSVDVVTQQITIAPGGSTGWHGHPGPVLVTIKSGAMTLVYANSPGCAGRTYTAGQSFVDRGDEVIHNAFNLGSEPLDFWATYLVPGAPGAAFRIDAPDPGTCTGGVSSSAAGTGSGPGSGPGSGGGSDRGRGR